MSNGASAQAGIDYQYNYGVYRVVCAIVPTKVPNYPKEKQLTSFGIESPAGVDGPAWDIFLETEAGLREFIEAKDTKISSEDRKRFYLRLRKELEKSEKSIVSQIGWVTDKEKNTPAAIASLEGIAAAARDYSGAVPLAPPERVASSQDALQEAVYYLCSTDNDNGNIPPLLIGDALGLLCLLRVECFRAAELRDITNQVLSSLFASRDGQTVREHILGFLLDRVTEDKRAQFFINEFITLLESKALRLNLPDTIASLFGEDSGIAPSPVRATDITWDKIPGKPTTHWMLSDRLPALSTKMKAVVEGSQGTGKTAASVLELQRVKQELNPAHCFWVNAADLSVEKISHLPRLCSLFSGIDTTCLIIDSLDELPPENEQEWRRSIDYLKRLPSLLLRIFVRSEVLVISEPLRKMAEGLDHLVLDELSSEQVRECLEGLQITTPLHSEILDILRNPLLLSLFAQDATASTGQSLAVEACGFYGCIRRFIQRRIESDSQGLRGRHRENSLEEKQAAFDKAQRLSVEGAVIFQGDATSRAGLNTLVAEGVLIRTSHNAYRWRHDAFREYAVTEYVITSAQTLTGNNIAVELQFLESQAVKRLAATGIVRWLVDSISPDLSLTEYLIALWKNDSSLARDALSVALREYSGVVIFDSFPTEMLIEAIEFARQLKLDKWARALGNLSPRHFEHLRRDDLLYLLVTYRLPALPRDQQLAALEESIVNFDLTKTTRRTLDAVLTAIKERDGITSAAVRKWLSSLQLNEFDAVDLLEHAVNMFDAGYREDAVEVVRAALWLSFKADWEKRYHENNVDHCLSECIEKVWQNGDKIAEFPSIWGPVVVELLDTFCREQCRHENIRWSKWVDFEAADEASKEEMLAERPGAPYDDLYLDYLRGYRVNDNRLSLADTMTSALRSAASQPTKDTFVALTESLFNVKWGFLICLPLEAMFDHFKDIIEVCHEQTWQLSAAKELLCCAYVLSLDSTRQWRFLLRDLVLNRLSRAEQEQLLDAIRKTKEIPFKIDELGQLLDTGLLSPDEETAVKERLAKDELIIRMADPRTEPDELELKVGEPDVRGTKDRFGAEWPEKAEEHLLTKIEVLSSQLRQEKTAVSVEKLVEAISVLRTLEHQEAFRQVPYLSYGLDWYSHVLEALKQCVETAQEAIPEKDAYEGMLDWLLPGWHIEAQAALDTLGSAPPPEHEERKSDSPSYGPNDKVACALEYLDALLATKDGPVLIALRTELAKVLGDKWKVWPEFTRLLTIVMLRNWNWARTENLSTLLIDTVCRTDSMTTLSWVLSRMHIFSFAQTFRIYRVTVARLPLLQGDQHSRENIVRITAGNASYAEIEGCRSLEAEGRPEVLALWEQIDCLPDSYKLEFAQASLWQVEQSLHGIGSPSKEHAAILIRRLQWASLVFGKVPAPDRRDPWESLLNVFSAVVCVGWEDDAIKILSDAFFDLLILAQENGSYGTFYHLQEEVPVWLGIKEGHMRGGHGQRKALSPFRFIDDQLLKFSSLLVTRVGMWKRQRVSINDFAYSRILSGLETAKVLETLASLAKDPDGYLDNLRAIVDEFIDCGFSEAGIALRTRLFHV